MSISVLIESSVKCISGSEDGDMYWGRGSGVAIYSRVGCEPWGGGGVIEGTWPCVTLFMAWFWGFKIVRGSGTQTCRYAAPPPDSKLINKGLRLGKRLNGKKASQSKPRN